VGAGGWGVVGGWRAGLARGLFFFLRPAAPKHRLRQARRSGRAPAAWTCCYVGEGMCLNTEPVTLAPSGVQQQARREAWNKKKGELNWKAGSSSSACALLFASKFPSPPPPPPPQHRPALWTPEAPLTPPTHHTCQKHHRFVFCTEENRRPAPPPPHPKLNSLPQAVAATALAASLPSRNPFLARRGRSFMYRMRPVPVVLRRRDFSDQLTVCVIGDGGEREVREGQGGKV